jgi:hypothetical protein
MAISSILSLNGRGCQGAAPMPAFTAAEREQVGSAELDAVTIRMAFAHAFSAEPAIGLDAYQ